MRVVLDTNTAISGLLWNGPPHQVINAAISGAIRLFSSQLLLDELEDVLRRPKLATRLTRIGSTEVELLRAYRALVTVVAPQAIPAPVSVDPDDAVLACAIAAQADAVVSGDDDLLRLKGYQSIAILTAPELLVRIAAP